jgi:hypothetical protein
MDKLTKYYNILETYKNWTDVTAKWLALLFHNWEVPVSNLGPETDYPDWGFLQSSSVPPGKC